LWGVVFLLPTRDCHSPANVSFLVLEMTFQSSKCGEFLDHPAMRWTAGNRVARWSCRVSLPKHN
jgi:hypothetical protein